MTTPPLLDQESDVPQWPGKAAPFMTRVLPSRLDPWREIR